MQAYYSSTGHGWGYKISIRCTRLKRDWTADHGWRSPDRWKQIDGSERYLFSKKKNTLIVCWQPVFSAWGQHIHILSDRLSDPLTLVLQFMYSCYIKLSLQALASRSIDDRGAASSLLSASTLRVLHPTYILHLSQAVNQINQLFRNKAMLDLCDTYLWRWYRRRVSNRVGPNTSMKALSCVDVFTSFCTQNRVKVDTNQRTTLCVSISSLHFSLKKTRGYRKPAAVPNLHSRYGKDRPHTWNYATNCWCRLRT